MHYTFVHKSARHGNVTTFTETTLQSQLYISTNQECLFKHNLGCKNSGNNDAHEKLLDLFIPIIWKNNRLCPPFFYNKMLVYPTKGDSLLNNYISV